MQTKILIVEDEAITAMDIKRTLVMLSFEVVSSVGTGKGAIEKTGALKPDLVLMDIVLKGDMDGIETAKIIKEQFDIPIVYLTAHSDEKTFQRAKLTEPYGFVFKPINHDGLKSTIETAIYKHGLDKKLKENEEMYHSLFENSLDAVLLTIPDGAILVANPTAEKMFGYSEEEICKMGRSGLVDIKDPRLYTLLDERTRKGKAHGELTFIRKDGTKFLGEVYSNIFKDMRGNEKTSMVIKDISKRKEAEDALKSSQQMLENVMENFPGVVFWKDRNSVYLGCNKNFSSRAGLAEPSEIIGKSDFDQELPWKNEAELYRADDLQVIESGIPKLNIIETLHQVDGHVAYFDTNKVPLRDHDENVIGVLGTSNDITERIKMEEELRQARDNLELKVKERTAELQIERDKLNNILNTTKNGIYIVNNDYEIEYVNPVIEKDFGTFKNQKCHDYFYDNDIFCSNCKLEDAFKGKTVKNEIHSTKTGKDYDSVSMPIYNLNGFRSVLTIMNDVTEHKRVQKENEKLIGELQRSNDDLQQFAYVTSHDLQEPLRTIASFTQLLERRYKNKLDDDADEFMDYIVDAAKRMQQLINDLLEYSRVTTKEKHFKPVDVNKVLDTVQKNLKTSIDENTAEITHDKLPTVMADDLQLVQLFQNLIGNAIKFRKEDEPPKIHISAKKDEEKGEYVFSVVDNGIGMEPQYAERIFVIFQRLHTRDVYSGTGIGLSVARKIVERHGGHIWVDSSLGEGSTFYFTIPLVSDKN